jgi:hypothetical protein
LVIDDEPIRLGGNDLLKIHRTIAMNGEKLGGYLRRGGKHNPDLHRGYLRERGRKLGWPGETAGEHNGNRCFSEHCLTDLPDPIGQEHPSAPRWKHGECPFQPFEKPFWIETPSGEIVVVVVDPTSFWAEVTRLSSDIELDDRIVILIASPATNRAKCRTRF